MKKKLGAVLLAVVLVLTLGLVMAAPVGASPAPAIAGLWHFDGDALDSSGNGNNGTVYGGAGYVSGMFDLALSLDGSDDYVEVAHADSLDMTSAYTVEAWVNVTDVPSNIYRPILFRGATNANDIEVYVQAVSNGLVVAHNRGNGGTFDFVRFVAPPIGTLFHLAVTFDGTDVKAYYNGIAQGVTQNTTAMVAPLDTNKGWWIGKVDHTAFGTLPGGNAINLFKGIIDEVRIWNEALPADRLGLGVFDVTVNAEGSALAVDVDYSYGEPYVDVTGTETTEFTLESILEGTKLTLTAPATHTEVYPYIFDHWSVNGTDYDTGKAEVTFAVTEDLIATAHYTMVISVNKELTLGDPDAVPLFTKVYFTMTITVHAYAEVTDVYVEDGIGADLVVNSPAIGSYSDYPDTGQSVEVWKASTKGKMSATKIGWTIGEPTVSEDNTLDIVVYTGTNAKGKQEYTSTGTHYLNSGPKVYFTYDGTTYMLQGPSVMVTVVNGD